MSSPVSRSAGNAGTPQPELAQARLRLVRTLPWIQERARRTISPQILSRLGSSPEDLSQLAAMAALARLEAIGRQTGALPSWSETETAMRSYLGGILWRLTMRLVRETGGHLPDQGIPEMLAKAEERSPMEAEEDRAQAQACLAHMTPDELQLVVGFGAGASYAEMARQLGVKPDALAKRRERILKRLLARCHDCTRRKDLGCSWVPLDWAG